MTSTLSVQDTHPKKDFSAITQLGLKALGLAQAHAAALEPRLPQDMVKELESDLGFLGAAVPGAKQARLAGISATTTQNAELARGYERVQQIRAAVRRAKVSAEVQRAYGVGVIINARVVRDVKVANRTANRILAATARIEGAGRLEFAHDAVTRASFEALGVGTRRKRKTEAQSSEETMQPTG